MLEMIGKPVIPLGVANRSQVLQLMEDLGLFSAPCNVHTRHTFRERAFYVCPLVLGERREPKPVFVEQLSLWPA